MSNEADTSTEESLFANDIPDEGLEAPRFIEADSMEALFGTAETEEEAVEEDEEVEETEVVEEDSEEDEEVEEPEDDDEEIEDINWQEITETLKTEKANLNKALHAEREERKKAIAQTQQLEAQLTVAKNNSAQEQLDKVVAQIKELDLEDVIKVEKPVELDPRLQALLAQQEGAAAQQKQAAQVASMQAEVSGQLDSFPNINAESNEQGQILAQMIMMNVSNGAEMSEAVATSMQTLNSLLGTTTEGARATRKPAVKPKAKPIKAATRAKKTRSTQKSAIDNGDFKSFFAKLGSDMAGNN